VNSSFWKAAIQLEFLINDWCAAHSRHDLLITPPAAMAEEATVEILTMAARSSAFADGQDFPVDFRFIP